MSHNHNYLGLGVGGGSTVLIDNLSFSIFLGFVFELGRVVACAIGLWYVVAALDYKIMCCRMHVDDGFVRFQQCAEVRCMINLYFVSWRCTGSLCISLELVEFFVCIGITLISSETVIKLLRLLHIICCLR